MSTLTYHLSLHGSGGQFRCTHCDYAANRAQNLTAHAQVHRDASSSTPKKKPPAPRKPPSRSFPCTKCPAVFYKQDRFERHSDLHGKDYKFRCAHCDYSVRFAANLIKHRQLHAANPTPTEAQQPAATDKAAAVSDGALWPATGEVGKTHYQCDRCPYAQPRKDAVQSHQRRHWYSTGFKCPYCDYSSMQSTFVHSHIKMHITPSGIHPPSAFLKFQSFKIVCREEEGGEETTLYDDTHKKRTHSTDSASPGKKVPVVVLSDILESASAVHKWNIPPRKQPSLVVKISKVDESYSVTHNGD